jgi:threonine/homoserine/homoserine lactone efflux protein
MMLEAFAALALFSLVTSITPGPNNLMLLASGANFGFRPTIPHMLGISLGHAFMVFLVGMGLIRVFDAYPVAHTILKVASVLYMTWLAWKIAHAAPASAGEAGGRPLTLLQAAGFQWVNPKAWAMALTAVAIYMPGEGLVAVLLVAAVFAAVNLPSVSVWTVLGQQIARLLTSRRRLLVFNWSMALLLMASLYPVLWPA